jgi:broad specificity phosphatase PhoE
LVRKALKVLLCSQALPIDEMIYLIRHCSTVENESGILCSDKDLELSDKGIQQANKLSEWFADKAINLILTSNTLRTTQTASYISKITKAEVKEYSELRERDVGSIYTNLRLNELTLIRSNHRQKYFDPTQDWNGVSDVESDISVFTRTKEIFQEHIDMGKDLACVTHAGVIKAFIHSVFRIDESRANAFKVKNGCVLVFQNENDFDHIRLVEMYQLQ